MEDTPDTGELRRLAQQAVALRRVATAVAAGKAPDDLFVLVAREAALVLAVEGAGVVRFEDGDAVNVGLWSSVGVEMPLGHRQRLSPKTPLGTVYFEGRPAWTADYRTIDAPGAKIVLGQGYVGGAAAPIRVDGEQWGAVLATTTRHDAIGPKAARILQDLAELLGLAIANAESRRELAGEVRRRTELADIHAALHRVARTVAMEPDLESVTSQVAEEAARLLGADSAGVLRFEAEGSGVPLALWPPEFAAAAGDDTVLPLDEGTATGRVWLTHRPQRVDAYKVPPHELVEKHGMRSAAAAPILTPRGPWGVVVVGSHAAGALPDQAEERLGEFAELISVAITNAESRRALAEEVRRRTELANVQAALHRVARTVATEPGLDPLAQQVAEEATRLLGAQGGGVVRFSANGDAQKVAAWPEAMFAALPPDGVMPFDEVTALGMVWLTREPARVEAYERRPPEVADQFGFTTAAAAPIFTDQGLWGAVAVASVSEVPLPPHSEERLGAFAELIAVAIANADAHAELLTQARSDPLTFVANHRTFYETLAAEVRRATRYGRDLSLVLVDLDGFKELNDSYGHQEGDRVLTDFAARLTDMVRGGELVARLGGDEFAIVLPESDDLAALGMAERVRRTLLEDPLAGDHPMTLSAGICDVSLAGGDPEELVRLADRALYWAKSHGRNQCWRYSIEALSEMSDEDRAARLARSRALAALRSLARVVDLRDPSTQRHSERVAHLVCRLAEVQGWGEEEIDRLREAALIHDVGKVAIRDAVLYKPGPLDDEEYEEVKRHAAIGAEIASEALSPEQVAWIRHHHERADGRGYPDGLSATEIPAGAQLLAVADAWDVMTNARHYTTPIPALDALAECRSHRDRQFTPYALDALERLWVERRFDLSGESDTAPFGTHGPRHR